MYVPVEYEEKPYIAYKPSRYKMNDKDRANLNPPPKYQIKHTLGMKSSFLIVQVLRSTFDIL